MRQPVRMSIIVAAVLVGSGAVRAQSVPVVSVPPANAPTRPAAEREAPPSAVPIPRPLTLDDLPSAPKPPSLAASLGMSDVEYVSAACIAGAATAGVATLLGGGVAIVAGGGVATATGSAIAVPVLVATVAAGCGVAQSMAPGFAWLQRQGTHIVDSIETPKLPIP